MSVHGRQSLTLRDKVDIINAVNNGAKRKEILEQYQLPPSTLSSLLRHKDQLLKKMRERKVSPSSKRIRSVDSAELEEEMKAFVSDCRRDDVALTGGLMLSKAKEIALKLGLSNFRASRGWLYNFKKRHGISPGKNNILFNLLNSDQIVKVNLCSEDSAWSNITKEKEHAEGTVNLNQDIHKPMDNEYLVAANPPLHFERAALKVEALDDTNEDFQHDQNNANVGIDNFGNSFTATKIDNNTR